MMEPQLTITFPGSFFDGWVTVGLPWKYFYFQLILIGLFSGSHWQPRWRPCRSSWRWSWWWPAGWWRLSARPSSLSPINWWRISTFVFLCQNFYSETGNFSYLATRSGKHLLLLSVKLLRIRSANKTKIIQRWTFEKNLIIFRCKQFVFEFLKLELTKCTLTSLGQMLNNILFCSSEIPLRWVHSSGMKNYLLLLLALNIHQSSASCFGKDAHFKSTDVSWNIS